MSSRSKTSVRPSIWKSAPSSCGTPFTNTSNGRTTSAGSRTRVPSIRVLRHLHRMAAGASEALSVCAALLLAVARACRIVAPPADIAQFTPVAPESPNAEGIRDELPLRLDLRLRDLRARRGLLIAFIVRYRRRKRAALRGRRADPRRDEARARVDGGPGVDPLPDRGVRLHRAARDQGHPVGERGRAAARDQGDRPPVLLAVRVPERRDRDRHDASRRPGVPVTPRGRRRRTTTSSTRGGSPRSAARSTRFPAGRTRPGSRPTTPGTYTGQCAELCGLEHARMLASVRSCLEAEFDAWLDAAPQRSRTQARGELGKETWEGVCAKCHGLAGEGGIGPRIAGSPTLADPAALENLVRNGRAHDARRRLGLDERADRGLADLPEGEPAEWQLELRRYPPGSAARSRAGSSRRTTSGSGSSTSRRRSSSSSSPG